MIGQTIGPYQIIRKLGEGGMGTVYLAVHRTQGYQVALKLLAPYFEDEPARRRFEREARALVRLQHANIIHVYDWGRVEGRSYIAMQYIEGGSLRDRLQLGRPLDLAWTVGIITQVASALDHAHAQGIVHRDVKPSNVLLTQDDRPVLTDFGLAVARDLSRLSASGAILGTPDYLSPEQARGIREVDRRTDVYSLGVVCYQMLTGRVPFARTTPQAVLYAHVHETPPPVRRLNRRLSPAVQQVIQRALAKSPERRWPTAGSFAQALAGAAAGRTRAMGPREAWRRWDLLGVGLAGIVALLLLSWFLLPSPDSGGTPTAWSTAPSAHKVAFESDRDGNREIYAADLDGSHPTRLTVHPSTDWAPAWSPDGGWLAFVSERDGNHNVYLMDRNGEQVRRLTDHPAWDSAPTWSPDGKRIAFDSNRDGDFEIYLMNRDGSKVQQLTDNDSLDGDPAWSPDGRLIAFVSDRDGNMEVYVMDADGGDQHRLTQNQWEDASPAWSPNGLHIAFQSRRELGTEVFVVDRDGGNQERLTNNNVDDNQPSWSPDGKWIACARRSVDGGRWDIYRLALDHSEQVPWIRTPNASNMNPAWQPWR